MMIRSATRHDEAAIQNIAVEAYTPYVQAIGRPPAPMIADFGEQIEQGIVYVYDFDDPKIDNVDAQDVADALAGFIVFYPSGDHMQLENVAVADHARGRGVGGALIQWCEHCARQSGLVFVELYTNEKMLTNLSLYPHLGYEEIDRYSEDGFNRVFYRKVLSY